MWRKLSTPTLFALALAVAGCGTHDRPKVTAPAATPAADRVRTDGGQIVLRGDVAPDAFGPLALRGRYRLTFVQRGAGVDFGSEVPFTVHLEQDRPGRSPRRLALVQRAARTGATSFTATGRWRLLVDFGDSPFAITLTPAST